MAARMETDDDGVEDTGDAENIPRYACGDYNLIPLNLTSRYAHNWGTWEGIREFIQNWHDGTYDASDNEVQLNPLAKEQTVTFPCTTEDDEKVVYTANVTFVTNVPKPYGTLHYDVVNKRLTLVNKEVCLQKKILLLGYSSKSKHKEVIGQFGEGLKIGALALVRQGRYVTMETNQQRWKFALHPYEQFGGELGLVVIESRSERTNQSEHQEFVFPPCPVKLDVADTSVSISPVSPEEFRECRERFLFLTPPKHCVTTELGTLLLDEMFSGDLFVKGTFVVNLKDQNLVTGVNFSDVKLDRDRNAVQEMSEIDHKVSCMWLRALAKNTRPNDLAERYYKLLVNNPECRDVRHASKYAFTDNSQEVKYVPKMMAEEFHKANPDYFPVPDTYPKDALPSLQDELGVSVFPCNEVLLALLHKSGRYKTLEEARAELQPEPQAEYAPGPELTPEQMSVLRQAIQNAHIADPDLEANKIEIIHTPNNEKPPALQEGRLIIPSWMLEKDVMHKHGQLCKKQGSRHCFCRQIRICNALLSLRKRETGGKPERHANEHPPDQSLMTIIAHFTHDDGKRKAPYCVQVHQSGQVLDQGSVHAECTVQEEELRKKIKEKKLEFMQSQKDHQEELARLNHECAVVRKDLMNNMVRDSVTDQKLDEVKIKYDKQLEEYKIGVQGQLQDKDMKIKEKDDILLQARRDLIHKETMLERQAQNMEQFSKSKDHRHIILVEKVTHYKAVLEQKAAEVQRMQTDVRKTKSFAQSLCKEVALKCNEICSELEGQTYLCSRCKKSKKSHIFFPCHHYKFCEKCATEYVSKRCPVSGCKKTITSAKKIYE